MYMYICMYKIPKNKTKRNNTLARNRSTLRYGMNTKKWGYHLLLDCADGDLKLISSRKNISSFVNELVKKIDMKKYGKLWINRFALHDESKSGISFMQMIETSNITGHFIDKTGNFYIDVFSCKPYDQHVVVQLVKKYFKPVKIRQRFIYRD
jgi:S-adenosylmethionine/arginine decarboxylase-like enzyme